MSVRPHPFDRGGTITTFEVEGVEWEEYAYSHGETIFQRRCPDCERGLLLSPARFHGDCQGTGFLATTVDPRGTDDPPIC